MHAPRPDDGDIQPGQGETATVTVWAGRGGGTVHLPAASAMWIKPRPRTAT